MDYEQAYRWLHGDRVEYSGCRSAAEAMESEVIRLRALVREAPNYFHPGYDFDGKKLEWIKTAGIIA